MPTMLTSAPRPFAACALALVTGCGGGSDGGGTTEPPPPVTGSFSLGVATPSVTTTVFTPTTATVTVTREGGYTGGVTLGTSGLPSFVNAVFSPAVVGAGVTSSVLTIGRRIGPNGDVATFPFTVTGSASGLPTQTAAMQLTLIAGTFSLAATPATLTIRAGSSGTSGIAITRPVGSESEPIPLTLSLISPPNGIVGVFNPAAPVGSVNSSTLTLSVRADVAPGQYPITVTGSMPTAGGAPITITVTVTQ